jgi:hypothetical protein
LWVGDDEQARKLSTGSMYYSPIFQPLRQLCDHPAASADWAARLAGGANAQAGARLHTIEELRTKFIQQKENELTQVRTSRHHRSHGVSVLGGSYTRSAAAARQGASERVRNLERAAAAKAALAVVQQVGCCTCSMHVQDGCRLCVCVHHRRTYTLGWACFALH